MKVILTGNTIKDDNDSKRPRIDIPNLEFKLNSILNKEGSTWPSNVERRELKEGDVILVEGTLFGIGHDKLYKLITESGPLSWNRIYEEIISKELDLLNFVDEDYEYSWGKLENLPSENLKSITPDYYLIKLIHEKFWEKHGFDENTVVMVDIVDFYTRSLYFNGWKVYYSEEDFTEREAEFFIDKSIRYLYND